MNSVVFNKIGENAGIVWRALQVEKYTYEELVKVTGLKPMELAAAIGWLAREGKIHVFIQDDIIHFETYNECYF